MKQVICTLCRVQGIIAFYLLVLLLAIPAHSFSQSSFFTSFQSNQVSMTTAQNTRYLALRDTAVNKSVHIVSTYDVRTYQSNDTLSFQLPGRSDTLTAVATAMVYDTLPIYFSWSAKLIGNVVGYLSLHYRNNEIFGFIQAGSDFYELLPMDSTHQFLVKRRLDNTKDCATPVDNPLPLVEPLGPGHCSAPTGIDLYNPCAAVMTVLLVITDEAKTWILQNYNTIDEFALEGEGIVNLAFLNSEIENKAIKVKWIERDYSSMLSDPPDIEFDRKQLPEIMDSVRLAQLADVAFLITNQEYTDAAGAVTDIAVDSSKAYGIIEAPFFNASLTFPHEFGHLLACHHNWIANFGNDDTDVIAHALRHVYPPDFIDYELVNEVNSWHTLVGIRASNNLAYIIEDEEGKQYLIQMVSDNRILHYSNPDVFIGVNQEATGNVCANNAAQIRNAACEVAEFLPSPDLSVLITTTDQPCSRQFSASIVAPAGGFPGVAPYTVKWFWSAWANFSNNTTGTYLGSGQTIILDHHPACTYWLKCELTSSDGIVVNAIRKIEFKELCCSITDPPDGGGGEGERAASPKKLLEISVSPNPSAAGEVVLSLSDTRETAASFALSNSDGSIQRSGNLILDYGKAMINTHGLKPGLYFLQVKLNSGDIRTIKLAITTK